LINKSIQTYFVIWEEVPWMVIDLIIKKYRLVEA